MTEAMRKDKKAEEGKVHFVLPLAIGNVEVVDMTVEEVLGLMSVK
jgi:3-dehydroquinate synthetase